MEGIRSTLANFGGFRQRSGWFEELGEVSLAVQKKKTFSDTIEFRKLP